MSVPDDDSRAPGGPGAGESEFLLMELAIDSPLAELRRLYAKKLRAFESGDGDANLDVYRRAFELAEEKLLRKLGEAHA